MEKLITILLLFAQITIAQNVQDCQFAIPICQNHYYVKNSYVGSGNISNEIPTDKMINGVYDPGSCLVVGEFNSIWYRFKVNNDDLLSFVITPNYIQDDYDWAVYDLTGYNCKDIINDTIWRKLEVACNYAHPAGQTGLNELIGIQNDPPVKLKSGHNYVLYISNFSYSPFGYTLDIYLGRKNPIIIPYADFIASPQPTNTRASEITFENKSKRAIKWWWTFYDKDFTMESEYKDPFYLYTDSGIYDVRLVVEDLNGCRDTTNKRIIIDPEYVIYIPNSFTPNNDKLNDEFKVIATGIEDYSIEIYDRRGIIIFKSTSLNDSWNGKDFQPDVYQYIITFRISKKLSKKDSKEIIIGTINLMN